MPLGCLLVSVGELKNRGFAKRFALELKPDGQAAFCESTRNTDATDTRKVAGNGEDIREIHL